MRKSAIAGFAVLALSFPAAASQIYKCEDSGAVTYTDQPCLAGAVPYELPTVVVMAAPSAFEKQLARQYDARIDEEREARDRADAKWLEQRRGFRDHAERVRNAIIEHRVIRGMTLKEVKRSLGPPDRAQKSESHGSRKETWIYDEHNATRRVNFKNGEVSTASRRERETSR